MLVQVQAQLVLLQCMCEEGCRNPFKERRVRSAEFFGHAVGTVHSCMQCLSNVCAAHCSQWHLQLVGMYPPLTGGPLLVSAWFRATMLA